MFKDIITIVVLAIVGLLTAWLIEGDERKEGDDDYLTGAGGNA